MLFPDLNEQNTYIFCSVEVTTMKTVILEYPFQLEDIPPTVIALGSFDGIHLAHEKLIQTAVKIAHKKGFASAVMTFNPHPKEVIFGEKVNYLMSFTEKKKKLAKMGIDILYCIRFTKEIAAMSPKTFVEDFLIRLQAQHVVVGFDFTYGYKAKGNVHTLLEDGDYRYGLTVIPKIEKAGEKVGSTQIRNLIRKGFVDQVPDFLGHYYSTEVYVQSEQVKNINGKYTLQISPLTEYQIPLQGVYEVIIHLNQVKYYGSVRKVPNTNKVFQLEIETSIPNLPETLNITWIKRKDSLAASSLSI